jgi:hypothetical protein
LSPNTFLCKQIVSYLSPSSRYNDVVVITTVIFSLNPKETCVETPKEVCTRSRRNPRRVNRPIIKKWCYTPSSDDESADIDNPLFGANADADLGDYVETAAEEGEEVGEEVGEEGSGNDGGENEGRTFRG